VPLREFPLPDQAKRGNRQGPRPYGLDFAAVFFFAAFLLAARLKQIQMTADILYGIIMTGPQ
jgi:hypothetical protein